MPDQAAQLRKLVRATVQADPAFAPSGPTIALTGSRAETGTTTVACQLARELTRLGKEVVLVDANVARPRAAALLKTESNGGFADVLRGARRAAEVLLSVDGGMKLLAGGAAGESTPPLDQQAFDRFAGELAALGRQADAILIDAGSGMNPWIDRLWQLAHQTLLVSTPQTDAFLDGYAAVKLSHYRRHGDKIRMLLNRTSDESEFLPFDRRFDDTCRKFLNIAPKPAVAMPAFMRNDSMTPDEPFQRAVRLLAADLTAEFRVAALRLVRPKEFAASVSRFVDSTELEPKR